MYKRVVALVFCLVMMAGLAGQALAAEESAPAVYVDGVLLENAHAEIYDQVTYVSFTALVSALLPGASITWETDRAVARADGLTVSARPGALYLEANDRYLYVADGILTGNNETLVPVRTLAQALGASVSWDGAVQISSEGEALVSGDQFYDESGNQPMEGKIAVGNVLLNRVAHPSFPSTLYDVIYQPGQFYPEQTGCMSKTPNTDSVIAAKLCLEGAVVVEDAYWFNGAGKSCWASRNKECVAVIGGHAFYG